MLLRRLLLSKRTEMRLLAAAMHQVAEIAVSENVGILSTPSAKRWADSLARTTTASGLGKGVAWTLTSQLAAQFIPQGPLRKAFRLADTAGTDTSVAEVVSAVLGNGQNETPASLPKSAFSGLWNSVPGVGVVKEVATLDGNLLFYEPARYIEQTRKGLDEVLTALPVGLGAAVLAAEAILKGGKVRKHPPTDQPQD